MGHDGSGYRHELETSLDSSALAAERNNNDYYYLYLFLQYLLTINITEATFLHMYAIPTCKCELVCFLRE